MIPKVLFFLFVKSGHINNLKVLYTGGQTTSCQKHAVIRHIPQQPDQVLDAPELIDDYCKYFIHVT